MDVDAMAARSRMRTRLVRNPMRGTAGCYARSGRSPAKPASKRDGELLHREGARPLRVKSSRRHNPRTTSFNRNKRKWSQRCRTRSSCQLRSLDRRWIASQTAAYHWES